MDTKRVSPNYFPLIGYLRNTVKDKSVKSIIRQNKRTFSAKNNRNYTHNTLHTYFTEYPRNKADGFKKSAKKDDDKDVLMSRQMEIDLPLVTVDRNKVKRKSYRRNFSPTENSHKIRRNSSRKNFFETGKKL